MLWVGFSVWMLKTRVFRWGQNSRSKLEQGKQAAAATANDPGLKNKPLFKLATIYLLMAIVTLLGGRKLKRHNYYSSLTNKIGGLTLSISIYYFMLLFNLVRLSIWLGFWAASISQFYWNLSIYEDNYINSILN